jgi:hypothetical protein
VTFGLAALAYNRAMSQPESGLDGWHVSGTRNIQSGKKSTPKDTAPSACPRSRPAVFRFAIACFPKLRSRSFGLQPCNVAARERPRRLARFRHQEHALLLQGLLTRPSAGPETHLIVCAPHVWRPVISISTVWFIPHCSGDFRSRSFGLQPCNVAARERPRRLARFKKSTPKDTAPSACPRSRPAVFRFAIACFPKLCGGIPHCSGDFRSRSFGLQPCNVAARERPRRLARFRHQAVWVAGFKVCSRGPQPVRRRTSLCALHMSGDQ